MGSNWSSWAQFVDMGGYGLYVWGSFGMCAVVLALELALLRVRRRALQNEAEGGLSDPRGSGA
ncbi:MAG: heme exporter protein CcmD [Burkholderiaceae bacterium]